MNGALTLAGEVGFLESLLGYQIRRASAAILADLAQSLAGLDLKITEASVMILIEERPDATQSDLGRMLGIQRANMAPLAATLTERGLIERTRADGRSQGLRLTDRGSDLVEAVRGRIIEHDARMLPVTDKERAVLRRVLARVWSEES